jgi:hypothetical protein
MDVIATNHMLIALQATSVQAYVGNCLATRYFETETEAQVFFDSLRVMLRNA